MAGMLTYPSHPNQDSHKHQQMRPEDVKPVGLLACSRGYKNGDAGGRGTDERSGGRGVWQNSQL